MSNCCAACGKPFGWMEFGSTIESSVFCQNCMKIVVPNINKVIFAQTKSDCEQNYQEAVSCINNSSLPKDGISVVTKILEKVYSDTVFKIADIQATEEKVKQIQSYIDQKISHIVVTTQDIKCDYEIIGPVYFQISNKGIFGGTYTELLSSYAAMIKQMQLQGMVSAEKMDWGFLYGEWSVGQSQFERAFYIATQELKKRAAMLEADAIIGMRQDIDLDTNGFSYFYLQMYGTAVKLKSNSSL